MTHTQKRRRYGGSGTLHSVDDLRTRSRSITSANGDAGRMTVQQQISTRPARTMLIALGAGFVLAAFLLRRSV